MGGTVTGSSSHQITQSYRQLSKLDMNGDSNISGSEVQFLNRLGQLGSNPNSTQISNLFSGVPESEQNAAVQRFVLNRIQSFGEHPTQQQLQGLVNSLPSNLQEGAGTFIESMFGGMDGPVEFDPFDKRITVHERLTVDPNNPMFSGVNEATTMAADVMDGDTSISGVVDEVSNEFLGIETRDDAPPSLSTESAGFDPNNFQFSFMRQQYAVNGDQSATLNMDVRRERITTENAAEARTLVRETSNGSQTFSDYAAEQGFSLHNFEPTQENIAAVREFANGISDRGERRAFLQNFMTATFAHVGGSIDQSGVSQSNYNDLLGEMPLEDDGEGNVTGRRHADCTYYNAISQDLDSGHGTTRNIRANFNGIQHDLSVIRNDDGTLTVQSNGEYFDLPSNVNFDEERFESADLRMMRNIIRGAYNSNEGFQRQFPNLSNLFVVGQAQGNDSFNTGVNLERGAIIGGSSVTTIHDAQQGTFTAQTQDSGDVQGAVLDATNGRYVIFEQMSGIDGSNVSGIEPAVEGNQAIIANPNSIQVQDGVASITGTLVTTDERSIPVRITRDASGQLHATVIDD